MVRAPVFCFVVAGLVAGAGAQTIDPVDCPVRVRVISREDGVPRPGVMVYVVDHARMTSTTADGWQRAVDMRVRALQVGSQVRTDPLGEATLLLPDGNPRRPLLRIMAGPPFLGEGLARVETGFVLRVDQHEPFSVQVVDAAGQSLARFPVALHAVGRDVAVALTDEHGLAVLGVPPDFSARLHVAPAGWIGPHDAFPTVTTSLRRQRTLLVVPPYGSVRLRAMRAGKPTLARVQCFLSEPGACAVTLRADGKPGPGVELAPVALGQQLRGWVHLDDRALPFLVMGPQRAGECVVVDEDVDPPRCKLALRLTGAGDLPVGQSVQVTVHTDAGSETHHASTLADGRILLDPRSPWRGERLLRVDLDTERSPVFGRDGVVQSGSAWSASVSVGRALAAATLDLGDVTLVSHRQVVAGRVVDCDGRPVPRAEVQIDGEDGAQPARSVGVFTDADGRFVLRSPVLRGADGQPVSIVVSTLVVDRRIAAAPVAFGAEVVLAVPTAAESVAAFGGLDAVFVDLYAAQIGDVKLQLVEAAGEQTWAPTSWVPSASPDAAGVRATWTRVPVGTYALRAVTWLGDELCRSEPWRIEADGVCRDPRLQALRCADAMQTVRLQVVDVEGVPIAGASLLLRHAEAGPRGAMPRVVARATDGQGRATLVLRRGTPVCVGISAPGKRPREVSGLPAESVVRLDPQGSLAVKVRGLPADVPRASVEVWLRHVERRRLDLTTQGRLDGDDVAHVPLPVAGSYQVLLLVAGRGPDGGGSTTVISCAEALEIGDGAPAPIEMTLDDAALSRLRQLLGGAAGGGDGRVRGKE